MADNILVFTLTEITSTMLAHISCVVIIYCCLVFLKQRWKLCHTYRHCFSLHNLYNSSRHYCQWYQQLWCTQQQTSRYAYALAAGLLVLGFLDAKTLNTDDCRGLLCFFRRVPPPLGLLPDGKQASWTRSRQFLCMFISQSATTTNISFSILLWSPYRIGQTIIFSSCGFFLSFFLFFFPRLISAATHWMSAILRHMVWP